MMQLTTSIIKLRNIRARTWNTRPETCVIKLNVKDLPNMLY